MIRRFVTQRERHIAAHDGLIEPDSSGTKQCPKCVHVAGKVSARLKLLTKPRGANTRLEVDEISRRALRHQCCSDFSAAKTPLFIAV